MKNLNNTGLLVMAMLGDENALAELATATGFRRTDGTWINPEDIDYDDPRWTQI